MRCRCDDAGAVFEDLGLQEECCGCKYDDVFLVSVFHLKCKEWFVKVQRNIIIYFVTIGPNHWSLEDTATKRMLMAATLHAIKQF